MIARKLILAVLLVMLATLIYAMGTGAPEGATGTAHPTIPAMKLGGDGLARLSSAMPAAILFHLLIFVLAGLVLYHGAPVHRRSRVYRAVIAGLCLVSLVAVSGLWLSYLDVQATGATPYFFGFPVPAAWMIYGHWGALLLYDAFYIVAFRRFFLHPDDEAAFEALVAQVQRDNAVTRKEHP